MLTDLTGFVIHKPIVTDSKLKDFKLESNIRHDLTAGLSQDGYSFNNFTSASITNDNNTSGEVNYALIPNQYFIFACGLHDFAVELYKYIEIFEQLRPFGTDLIGSCNDSETFINNTPKALTVFSSPKDVKPFCQFIERNNDKYRLKAKKLISDQGKPRTSKDCFSSVLLTQVNLPNASSAIFGQLVYDLIQQPNLYLKLRNHFVNTITSKNHPFNISLFLKSLQLANLSLHKTLPYRFISALQTKPFVILTGLSGSGKTKLAEAFSLWISESPDQYCMVSVGADWTNREPLLGFPNALETDKYVKPDCGALDLILRATNDTTNRPYFLILDEMNMSHVERYFADFLSAMESTDGQISLHPASKDLEMGDGTLAVPSAFKLPKNLFIIGTVNIDETTYMFSPKVLDRANVIEFRVSETEMSSFFSAPKELDMDALRSQGASMGESFVDKSNEKGLIAVQLGDALMPFFTKLQDAGAEFGYRSASEISRFVKICSVLASTEMTNDEVIDAAIIQKLLPKVHGSRNKIEKTLKELGSLCLTDETNEAFKTNSDQTDSHPVKYPLSYNKLKQMHKRVLSDGFTSFAEA